MSFRLHNYGRQNGFGSDEGELDSFFGLPFGDWPDSGNGDEVITVDVTAPQTRSAEELAVKIQASNGKLVVSGNASEMLVALNNRLRFSITDKGNGAYEISDRLAGNTLLYGGIAAAALVLVAVVAARG